MAIGVRHVLRISHRGLQLLDPGLVANDRLVELGYVRSSSLRVHRGERLPGAELLDLLELVVEDRVALQQRQARLLPLRVAPRKVLLPLGFTLGLPALEVPVPSLHLGIDLALRLGLEVRLSAVPLIHDLPGAFQSGGFFLHPPRVPELVLV